MGKVKEECGVCLEPQYLDMHIIKVVEVSLQNVVVCLLPLYAFCIAAQDGHLKINKYVTAAPEGSVKQARGSGCLRGVSVSQEGQGSEFFASFYFFNIFIGV